VSHGGSGLVRGGFLHRDFDALFPFRVAVRFTFLLRFGFGFGFGFAARFNGLNRPSERWLTGANEHRVVQD
jgi:hypothetical protein